MAKSKSSKSSDSITQTNEPDSAFILKVVLYLMVSSVWLNVYTSATHRIPLPVGALVALLFASHDHFRIDRKIEYAIILIAMFVGYWVPVGFTIYTY
jgi:hypothetical protein